MRMLGNKDRERRVSLADEARFVTAGSTGRSLANRKEEQHMRHGIKAALVAVALAGGSLAATAPAEAAENVTIAAGPGGIAFGYSDGYWDRDHHWHKWRNREEAAHWREENREHYFDRRHDRDHDQGWREGDRYWEHH
jgi:hypothetical protein